MPPSDLSQDQRQTGALVDKEHTPQPVPHAAPSHRAHVASRVTTHRAHSKSRQIRHLRIAVAGLILALLGVAMGAILAAAKLKQVESELLAVDSRLRGTARELEAAKRTLEQREHELVALVENRLPGMRPLELNRLLEIGTDYVTNITFSQSGVGEAKRIEYHAMLRNDSTAMILPRVTVFLFDEHGLQVGEERLDKMDATTDALIEELRPGESRSYHETISIKRGAVPAFFLIHVDPAKP